AGSDGIDPVTEAVRLQVGSYVVTIPAGSFRAASRGTLFLFEGVIDGAKLEIAIRSLGAGRFELNAVVGRVDLRGTPNPAPVSLQIGNDGGATTVPVREPGAPRR